MTTPASSSAFGTGQSTPAEQPRVMLNFGARGPSGLGQEPMMQQQQRQLQEQVGHGEMEEDSASSEED